MEKRKVRGMFYIQYDNANYRIVTIDAVRTAYDRNMITETERDNRIIMWLVQEIDRLLAEQGAITTVNSDQLDAKGATLP